MRTALFFTRLVLYFLLASVPYMLSAAIAVPYDRLAKLTWFFLVPAEMFIAYFSSYARTRRIWASPAAALGLLGFMILFFSEFSPHIMLLFCVGGLMAWLWTLLVFSRGDRFRSLAVLELFVFAFIYFKLLNFTRASEDIAEATGRMIHFVLFLAALSFLVHGIVLYYASFARAKASSGKRRRELFVFASFAIPLFLLISMALPANFLKHNPLETELDDEPPPKGERLNPDAEAEGKARAGRPPKEGNGLPLGDGEKKYPADRQRGGGSSDMGQEERERGQRPDEHRGGRSGSQKGQKDNQGGGHRQKGEKQGGKGHSGKDNQNNEGGGGGQGQDQSESQGGGQGQGQSQSQQQKQQQKKDKQRLEGIPSDQWSNRQQMSGASNKQFAVMVIASPVDPIYAARTYLGAFHPERGFLKTPDTIEPLNSLATRRLLETWQDRIADADDKRRPISTYFLSTEAERVLAYRPFTIQPSIRDTNYEPFSYSWNAVSRMSLSGPEDWKLSPELDERMKAAMKYWLSAEMPRPLSTRFQKYIKTLHIQPEDRPFARLEKILKGFKKHQYKMGFNEDTSTKHLAEFLLKTKEGDCTEFANSAALLARLNGIPSRVVHGYLGSKDLQTRYHKGGLKHLREKIKPLQKFKMDELYLITTSHRHAWIQVYLAGYGWIDFESTAYAIRPKPEFNPNKMDVVIPLIKERANQKKDAFKFPWRLALKVLVALFVLVFVTLYSMQALRQLYFHLRKGTKTKKGLRAYLMLLLIQMARDGYAIKAPHLTPLEYASNHESLHEFARLYAKLRFKVNYLPGEREDSERAFREGWKEVRRRVKRPGLLAFLKRRLSLRGLYY